MLSLGNALEPLKDQARQVGGILELEQWGTEEIGYTAETNRFAGEDGRTNLVGHIRVLGGSQ